MRVKISIILILLTGLLFDVNGQLFLQLEQSNSLEVKKYSPGDLLHYRTKEFGNNWLNDKIINVLPEDNALLFYDKIIHLDEITHIQYPRPWADATGYSLMGFGSGWLIYGGVIEGLSSINAIESNYRFGKDTAIIGVTAIASGYLIKKLWSKAVRKMNQRNRVRIIDVRF